MRKYLQAGLVTLGLAAVIGYGVPVAAVDPFGGGACTGSASTICTETGDKDKLPSSISNIVDLLLYALGIVAVIVIVIGGIMYTTSNGDSNRIKLAKDTVLYAVIGLVVALLAYAIVHFVVKAL